jgi:putative transcriptional regulator
MDTRTLAKDRLANKIAGEIVLSDNAGDVIQKWRNIFKIPQRRLADQIGVMPSVISDYENGRRKSPGIKVIKRMVDAMIVLDEKTGGKIIHDFLDFPSRNVLSSALLDMREFKSPRTIKNFCKSLNAPLVVRDDLKNNKIHGYSVIDSMKAIMEVSAVDMVKLYGLTSERVLIFTGAHSGRSSMVALKVTNLRPGLVILHGSERIDELAKRIAELEGIPVAITKVKKVSDLLNILKKN